MKKKVLTALLILLSYGTYAQKVGRVITMPPVTKTISLIDTTYRLTFKLSFVYNSDSNRLAMKADSVTLENLYGPFQMEDFRTVFNDYIVNTKKIDKPITVTSLIDLYYTVVDTIFGVSGLPVAGVLYLNNAVKVVTAKTSSKCDNCDEDYQNWDYTTRNRIRDSIQALVIPKQMKANAAQKVLSDYRDTLTSNFTIKNKTTGVVMKSSEISDTDIIILPKVPDTSSAKKLTINVAQIQLKLTNLVANAKTPPTTDQIHYLTALKTIADQSIIKKNGWPYNITDSANFPESDNAVDTLEISLRKIDTAGAIKALKDIAAYNDSCDAVISQYAVKYNAAPVSDANKLKTLDKPDTFRAYTFSPNSKPGASADLKVPGKMQKLLDAKIRATRLLERYKITIRENSSTLDAAEYPNLSGQNEITDSYYAFDTVMPDKKGTYSDSAKKYLKQAIGWISVKPIVSPPSKSQIALIDGIDSLKAHYIIKVNGSDLGYSLTKDDVSKITADTLLPKKNSILPADSARKVLMKLIKANDTAKANYDASLKAYKKYGIYVIKDVQLQFEKGFLERVQVTINYDDNDQIFENIYAIGFSSPQNYRNLTQTWLWVRNSNDNSTNAAKICLADVLQNYQNELDNYTRDYSPADTSFHVDPTKQMQVTLHRESFMNLFEAKAFTDLDGIGTNNPNGLIQIQIDRDINLITKRRQIAGLRADCGFLNYIHLEVNVSKIENKDRRLILSNQRIVNDNEVISPSYATNLDFRRYENFSIVLEPSIFLYDVPDAKMTFHVDFGFRYGYIPVTDSILQIDTPSQSVKIPVNANNYDANTLTIYPKVWVQVFTEKRFTFTIGYQFNTTWLFSNNLFKQVVSYSNKAGDIQTYAIDPAARYSHMIELTGRIQPNSKDKNGNIFLVARFFMQEHDVNTFFPQIQIGYAYNLLFKK